MDATIFLVNNGTLHLHLKKAQCRICAYWNGPCTVKPTSCLQTKLAEAGTKQMSQRCMQRHVSQPFLNKWSNFFFSHRIQGRAACPSFPSQCSTIRQTICCWPPPRCWSYFPSLEVEGFQALATFTRQSCYSRTKQKMRAFSSKFTCTLGCFPLPKSMGFTFTKTILFLHLVAIPKYFLPLWGSCQGPQDTVNWKSPSNLT